MKVVKLGNEGLNVPAVGLGCMGMSEFYGASDTRENLKVLDRAREIGCTFWDTADMYGPFRNEELLARALAGRREEITLATKFGISRDESGGWLGINGRPDYVRACCDASLKRLNTDYIDLYYQHRVDPNVPIEDTVGAMAELVAQGKVKYLGLSEADAPTLERAHKVHPIAALQTEYSLWSRDVEERVLPTCRRLGIGFVAYSPLGRGFLTGTITRREDLQEGDWRLSNPRFQEDALTHNRALLEVIDGIAVKNDITRAQVTLAWLLAQTPALAMIPGTRKLTYLDQNWSAMDIELSDGDLATLNQFSGEFLTMGARY